MGSLTVVSRLTGNRGSGAVSYGLGDME